MGKRKAPPKTFADLVEEAADCVNDCALSGDEADFFLGEFAAEAGLDLADLKAAVLHQLLDMLHGRHSADKLRHDHAELSALANRRAL